MKHQDMLVRTSLLSVFLLSLHLAQDAVYAKPGSWPAGSGNLTAILIIFVLLAGPLLLAERRSGKIVMLLLALFSAGMPVLHFRLSQDLNKYPAALLFVWGLLALGVTGILGVILSLQALLKRAD